MQEHWMSTVPDDRSKSLGMRLESWKQIAAHLNRHITTVRRWEKHEGLPVHRHVHSTLSSIYAYTSELDVWMQSRQPEPEEAACGTAIRTAPSERSGPPPVLLNHAAPSRGLLVGRNEEIERLTQVWQTSLSGKQQVAVIAGEAGQGKTRLVMECAAQAASQARVLTAVWDREALVPFAAFVSILAQIVKTIPPATLKKALKEIAGSRELLPLAPELKNFVSAGDPELRATAESRRFLMFQAFAQLIAALSRELPVVLILEDAHWADSGSVLFLRHLIRSTQDEAVCMLLTYREQEADSGGFSESRLREFQREFSITVVRLKGLAGEDVRRLVDTRTQHRASPQLTEWVIASTGGNPLFVTELLTHLEETGNSGSRFAGDAKGAHGRPCAIREVIRHRIARLSRLCQRLLILGAIVGDDFSLPLLERLIDTSEEGVLTGIEEAISTGMLRETPSQPGRFSFTHTLISETLYADTMAARRARLHHRVGEALERQDSPAMLPLGALAYHFTEGAIYDPGKAIDYAVRAGDLAATRLALEEAARYYGMALRTLRSLTSGLEITRRQVDLHLRSGRSWFRAGQWSHARADFAAALSMLEPEDLEKRCEVLIHLAEASFWLMDTAGMRRFADEAEVLSDRIGRDDLWADARAWVASAQVADGDVLGGIASDRRTLSRAGGIRTFGLARAPLTLYWAGQSAEASVLAEQAVEGAKASQDPAFLLYALQHLGICLSGAGRYDRALQAFDEACAFGRQCGASSLLARAASMSVAPLFSLGAFDRAEKRAMEARELARSVAFQPPLVSAGIDLLLIYARTAEAGKAESLLIEVQQAVEEAAGWHSWKWKMRLGQARAELALVRGQWKAAIQYADEVIEQSNWRHRPKYQAMALLVRAKARRALGVRKTVDDARASVEVARRIADPAMLAECLCLHLLDDQTEELVLEASETVDSVLRAVSDESLQRSFLTRLDAYGNRHAKRKSELSRFVAVGR